VSSEPKERGQAPFRAWSSHSPSDDSSAAHRRKLEAMFPNSGGNSSEIPVQRPPAERVVFAQARKSIGKTPSEYRLRLERLRVVREDDEIREAADVFLAHHQLPDDLDILYKLLRHPSEKVLRETMGQISSLLMQGRIGNTLLLEDRLNTIAKTVTEPGTMSFIEGLRAQILQLKQKLSSPASLPMM